MCRYCRPKPAAQAQANESHAPNPFDLTKVWLHNDCPPIKVGKSALDRNPTDFHTEIKQAAFEPNNLVSGIGLSPDKMLLGRGFQLASLNASETVPFKAANVTLAAVRNALSSGGSLACPINADPFIAYTLRQDDDDWGQPGTPVREVLDDAAPDRLVSNIVGHLKADVPEPGWQALAYSAAPAQFMGTLPVACPLKK